jgi:RHS repeat-associated protein
VGTDVVDTSYNNLGRVSEVTYPYRGTTSTGYDTYEYDALNRLTSITHADGDSVNYTYGSGVGGADGNGSQRCWTSGTGYPALFSDEDGNKRQMWTDQRGRLIEADEPDPENGSMTDSGALWACYLYSTANALTTVTQSSQSRSYNYDMLARLTSESNPESGTTTYTHDANGNVTGRTDARSITTTYTYDALNRLTSKSYSDGTTPTAHFQYDQALATVGGWSHHTGYPAGRLTSVCTTTGTSCTSGVQTGAVYNYDVLGRFAALWQCTPYNCSAASSPWGTYYYYDLAGDVTSWAHPAGFTVTNSINSAQEITQIQSSVGAPYPQQLASNITYEPWGAISTLTNGCYGTGQNQGCTQVEEAYTYDNRLQPVVVNTADFCMAYNYYASQGNGTTCPAATSGHGNNGSVLGFVSGHVNTSLNHTETFSYDSLNRLTGAVATALPGGNVSYNLNFSYDPYGNMTCVQNGSTQGPCPQYSFNSNNQVAGYSYDHAGDLIGDGTYTYGYDGEGRVTSVTGDGTANTYTYDALGQRATWGVYQYLHDPSGQLLAHFRTDTQDWYGQTVMEVGHLFDYLNSNLYMHHPDILGSSRSVTLQDGSVSGDNLLYPWGQLWTYTGNLFAGFQDWDGNVGSGMYPAEFRAYPVNYGRWLTPDPAGLAAVDLTNPQSLNRYAYVMNNPTTLTDPSGLDPQQQTCGHGFVVPQGQNPATWCYNHMGIGEGSGPGAFFSNTIDEFDLLGPTYTPYLNDPEGSLVLTLINNGAELVNLMEDSSLPGISDDGTGPAQGNTAVTQNACTAPVLGAVNNQFGTNFTANDVQGNPFNNGGAVNLNILGTGLPAAQFNSIQTGRYPGHWWGYFTGYGPTLHITGQGFFDPTAAFTSSNLGGATSVLFTAHIDYGFLFNPFGALYHLFREVLQIGGPRKPC